MRASWKLALIVASCLAFSWGVVAISAPPPNPKPDTSASTSRPAKSPTLATPSTSPAKPAIAPHEAQWIWSPAAEEITKTASPLGTCYFRRSFEMTQPESGEVQITADESYELYVNGRKVGDGHNWHVMDIHDITKFLKPGHNTVAVMAAKTDNGPAGLAARVLVKNAGDTFVSYLTGSTWKTSQKEFVGWTQPRFNESQWLPAREIGQFGVVKPWLDEMQLAGGVGGRFKISNEFRIEPVVAPQDTGSLIAMAFNEFGDILASREDGPLLIVRSVKPGTPPSKVSVYCDKVKSIQGILPLNGQVFVVGNGPQGTGLYRISEPGTAPIAPPDSGTTPIATGPAAITPDAAKPSATTPNVSAPNTTDHNTTPSATTPSAATPVTTTPSEAAPKPLPSSPTTPSELAPSVDPPSTTGVPTATSSRRADPHSSAHNNHRRSDRALILASAVAEATDLDPKQKESSAANVSELKPIHQLPDDPDAKPAPAPKKPAARRSPQASRSGVEIHRRDGRAWSA